ncbi:MATE family efflux transporter [Lachnospiraceae bacterium 45-W7]
MGHSSSEKTSPANLEQALASGAIGKTILFYAIPSVISLVVNGLYNIVDQIFIGQGIGYLGNSATNVIFPLTVFAAAVGILFGDGAATYLSLKLGRGEREEAKKGVSNGILISVFCGILLLLVSFFFLEPIEKLFGATETVLPYGLAYGKIIMIGFPFVLISTTLNSIIRADGSPKVAMASLLAGAIWNTIMDPIAIFVLDWGIEGVAIATVSGQFLSFLVSLSYITKFKLVKLKRRDYRFEFKYVRAIAPLGISGFINQMAIVVMTAVLNNILVQYGEDSTYGTDIPLAVMGIVLKINQILVFIIVGIASGAQPLISYNYGSGNTERVKKGFYFCITWATVISALGFLLFQLKPLWIINLFGSESELYNEFTVKCLRIFLLACLLNGFQTVSSIFVQQIEQPLKALLLSLSRQIVFLIPLAMFFPRFLGVEGVLWAGPAADTLAFLLALIVVFMELRKYRQSKPVKKEGMQ